MQSFFCYKKSDKSAAARAAAATPGLDWSATQTLGTVSAPCNFKYVASNEAACVLMQGLLERV
jgi:hypothetical protein